MILGFIQVWFHVHPSYYETIRFPDTLFIPELFEKYTAIDSLFFDDDFRHISAWLFGTILLITGSNGALKTLYGTTLSNRSVSGLIERSKFITSLFISVLILSPMIINIQYNAVSPLASLIPLAFFLTLFSFFFIKLLPMRRARSRQYKAAKNLRNSSKKNTPKKPKTGYKSIENHSKFEVKTGDHAITWSSDRAIAKRSLLLIIKVLLLMGNISRTDKNVLLQLSRKHYFYPSDVKNLMIEAVDTYNTLNLNELEPEHIYEICKTATADGYLNQDEHNLLIRVGDHMGFSKNEIETSLKECLDALKSS